MFLIRLHTLTLPWGYVYASVHGGRDRVYMAGGMCDSVGNHKDADYGRKLSGATPVFLDYETPRRLKEES